MSEGRLCSIEGCGGSGKIVRGWCGAHYQRWSIYGDPMGGGPRRALRDAPHRFLNEVIPAHEGLGCLFWPYGKDTAGYAKINSRKYGTDRVHRIVCKRVRGPAPTSRHEAAHSCGNGHLACVAQGHLDWKTPLENTADQLIHGTRRRGERHHMTKLREHEARQIILLKGKEKQAITAARFNVTRELVSNIQRRVAWGWLDA